MYLKILSGLVGKGRVAAQPLSEKDESLICRSAQGRSRPKRLEIRTINEQVRH
jgi:hypothetical protein